MTSELGRRIAFTVGALLIYRLGTYIPLPGLDPAIWDQVYRSQSGGLLGAFNSLSGGAIARLAIFSLNVIPYVSAAIIVQLAMVASRRLRGLRKRGEDGRVIIDQLTRALTVLLCVLQGLGIARAFEDITGLVANPGWPFVFATMLTLTAGTMFLVWLGTQITQRGVGNGIALLLIVGVLTQMPRVLAGSLELSRQGLFSQNTLIALAVVIVVAVGVVVLMELGRRHIAVSYAQREIGARTLPARSAPLTLKLNNAGTMPVILTSWLLLVPIALDRFGPPWLAGIAQVLMPGHTAYLILYVVLIVFCALFYTAFLLDPDESAASLQQHGGAIVGVEAGEATAAYIDQVVSRITLIGALYLAAVCLLPDTLIVAARVPFYFGGPGLLLVVCGVTDLLAQLRAYANAPRS